MASTVQFPAVSKDFRPALNALRAAASIWVVVFHFRHYSDYPWFDLFAVSKGYLGVDVFFVLSGLVICHVYLNGAVTSYSVAKHVRFLWLRLARLWPIHALLMVSLLIAAMVSGQALSWNDIADWISLTFLVRQWFLPEGYVWNVPAWSISAEFFAYTIIFPIVVAFVRSLGIRQAAYVLMAIGLLLYAVVELYYGTFDVAREAGPILRVMAGFSAGAGLYCFMAHSKRSRRWDKFVWLGLSLFIVSLFGQSDMLSVVSFCIALIGFYLSTGAMAHAFSVKPLFALGEWSFALYLIHTPAFLLSSYFADQLSIERGPAFCFAVLAISIAASAFTYRFVETPSRERLKELSSGRSKSGLAQQPT